MDRQSSYSEPKKEDPTPLCVKPSRSFTDLLFQFSERTSCVGPGLIGSSQTWNRRIVFVAFFLAAIVATIYITYLNFDQYYSYVTKSSISMGFSPLSFPTVSICNSNPVRRSTIQTASKDDFIKFLQELDKTDPYQQSDIFLSDVFWNETNWNETIPDTDDYYEDSYYRERKRDPRSQVMEEFSYLYQGEQSYTKLFMGHDIENMLVSCSFAGRQCDANDFTFTLSPEYGACYSFNSARSNNLTSYRSGSSHGLKLILYLETHEYISGLTSSYGGRVVVSQNGARPMPATNGLHLSAGTETDLGLKLVNISRLGQPYGTCLKSKNLTKHGGYTWTYVYTRQACQVTCFPLKVYETCQCILLSQLHLYPNEILEDDNVFPCADDKDKVDCVNQVAFWRYSYDNVTCDCPNPCWEPTYDAIMSSIDWPTNDYVNALEKVICKSPTQTDGCFYLQDLPMSEKRRNFLKVNIFFRDLNFESIKEEPDYPESQFYSDLGGSIGLFLGLSVLSLVEIIDFVFEILGWSLGKFCGQTEDGPKSLNQANTLNANDRNRPYSYIRPMPDKDIDPMNRIREPVRFTNMKPQQV